MPASGLPWRHALLAVAVMAVWGSNFVVMRIALDDLPPLLLATLRFTFAFLPMALFLPRPKIALRLLALYGVLIGAGQFGLLMFALNGEISPGLASLVVQVQVFFTIALAMRISGERVKRYQGAALALAAVGLGVIAVHSGSDVTPLGLVLVLAAALCWAGGNIVARATPEVNMLAYVVWASVFAIPPLLVASLVFEGWPAMAAGVANADAETWAAVLWQAVGNTMFGYGSWGWLLARYPAAVVSPMSLMVPLFGFATSHIVLGEPLQDWKLIAAALVLGGLALNLLWPALRRA